MPREVRVNKSKPQPKGKAGRPEHVPTKALREEVNNYAATGYPHQAIADCIKISLPTLYKHYRDELDFAKMYMLGRARTKLSEAIEKGHAWAIRFVLESQGRDLGWSTRHEITGADGAPLFNLSGLTEEELVTLRNIRAKITVDS